MVLFKNALAGQNAVDAHEKYIEDGIRWLKDKRFSRKYTSEGWSRSLLGRYKYKETDHIYNIKLNVEPDASGARGYSSWNAWLECAAYSPMDGAPKQMYDDRSNRTLITEVSSGNTPYDAIMLCIKGLPIEARAISYVTKHLKLL